MKSAERRHRNPPPEPAALRNAYPAGWRACALVQVGALARLEGDEGRAEAYFREALVTFRQIEDVRGVKHALAYLSRSTRRGLVTVLFGDIVGSTATATDLGTEDGGTCWRVAAGWSVASSAEGR